MCWVIKNDEQRFYAQYRSNIYITAIEGSINLNKEQQHVAVIVSFSTAPFK